MTLRVLDPTFAGAAAMASRPGPLPALAGRTVGLLDNGKFRVRELLDYGEELLRSQYGVADVLRFTKPDASRPVPAAMVAAMQRCDAVISAVGD